MKTKRLAVQVGATPHKPRKIADEIKLQIFMGKLKAGETLPSVRDAAEEWGQSKDTVHRAYKYLQAEGVIVDSDERGTLPRFIVNPEIKATEEPERILRLDTLMGQFMARARKMGFTVDEVEGASTRMIQRIKGSPRKRAGKAKQGKEEAAV